MVAAPKAVIVVDTVSKAAKVAPPTMLVTTVGVVKAGEVAKATTVPVPDVVYEVPQAEPVELAMPAPG